MNIAFIRTRWAAVGAAVAISLGAGGIGITHATTSSGPRAIYTPINPCRLADLRPAPFTVGPRTAGLGPNETYTLDGWGAVGDCSLPTGTSGLALNVTAVDPTAATFLRLWPAGGTQPTTSNLNPTPGQPPTPNAVNVGLSAAGKFSIFNRFGTVNVIVDVVGVYDDHNHDDRYYQKSEVDAAVGAKADQLDVYSGQLSVRYIGGSGGFTVTGASYPAPLPAGVATPTLEYLATGTSANCPGVGQAATAGVLCIYSYNSSNVNNVTTSGTFGGENKRFGFSVDVFTTNGAANGYFIGNWAYRLP